MLLQSSVQIVSAMTGESMVLALRGSHALMSSLTRRSLYIFPDIKTSWMLSHTIRYM